MNPTDDGASNITDGATPASGDCSTCLNTTRTPSRCYSRSTVEIRPLRQCEMIGPRYRVCLNAAASLNPAREARV